LGFLLLLLFCQQAYVQTNDDNLDKETQTEEITNKEKWVQHPAGVDMQPFGGWKFVPVIT